MPTAVQPANRLRANRRRLIRFGPIIAQLFAAGVAAAEEPPAAAPRAAVEEEVVVTGSRIPRKDLTTPAPVTVFTREDIEASGRLSVGDFLQQMPEQGNAMNTQVNLGGDGSTRVNLRGLGQNRTLVLLNGRRIVNGGTGADDSIDLGAIPTAAIERIEVLKDGASAAYGSDAIAGVVNLITRRRFQGAEATATSAISGHGDGQTVDLSLTIGETSERGSVLFSVGYYNQQAVSAGARDFSRVPIGFDGRPGGGPFYFGGGAVPAGRIVLTGPEQGVQNGNAMWNDLVAAFPNAGSFIYDPRSPRAVHGWRPFLGTNLPTDPVAPQDGYNYWSASHLITPSQRLQLFSTGDLSLGSFARAYYEATFVNRQSEQALDPTALFTDGLTVSKDNLYNPFGRDFASMERSLTEFGNRTFSQDIDTYRVVAGLDGKLGEAFGPMKGWSWDASLNYGRSLSNQAWRGFLRPTLVQNALGPSMVINGTPACVSVAGNPSTVIPGCVPLDLFHGTNSITRDQVAGLTFDGTDRGTNQMTAVQLNTGGELFPLLGSRRAALAAGYEYRHLYGAYIPDAAGENTFGSTVPTRGGYYLNEGYAELSLPVIDGVPGARALELTAGLRVFKYSNFGADNTYKLGGRWQIIRDVTLRGTYSTAYRAPSIFENYFGQTLGPTPVADPCSGVYGPPPASCGKAAGNGDQTGAVNALLGGNSKLLPEKARTLTLGVVLEPTVARGLTATIDYWNYAIDQSIASRGVAVILNGCYPTDNSPPRYCDLVVRDPVTQHILRVVDTFDNVGSDRTSGLDLALRYAVPTPIGRFGFSFDGTYLFNFDRTQADGSVIHARDVWDLGVYPKLKAMTRLNYELQGWRAAISWRYIGSFRECSDANGLFTGFGFCADPSHVTDRLVESVSTFDAYLSYELRSKLGKTTLSAGLNNAFDRKPALIYNSFRSATDPNTYDLMGRSLYARLGQVF